MKNIKIQLTGLMLLSATIIFGQVGVHTANPQGVFHVDGGRDNSFSGNPTITQQANDFLVSSTGAVGIGTTTPNSNLQVNGSLSMSIVTTNSDYTFTDRDYTVIFTGISKDAASHVTFTIPDPVTCKGRIYKINSLNGGGNSHGEYNADFSVFTDYGLSLSRPVIYAKDDDGVVYSSTIVYRLGNDFNGTKGPADRITIQSDGINWYCIDY
ncbi:hypothetical protein [Chryseobacterium herbae]|uniref:Uncharacterized protein n=1 Tax=Chryseobacterium herbae TaxID=2976476 RepID=A0ABT2ITZ9_9FLAO|nr:hypothetical protein [Chryseobacterium sp. pc1-10]MCT2562115.1 hypothetical protein [Chryseobacterium sp. pc1-10]